MPRLSEFRPPSMRHVAREAMLSRLGSLSVGTRLPPLVELAREMGVGRITLLEVIRELAGEGFVVARPRLGTIVARRPVSADGHLTDSRAPTLPLAAAPLAGRQIAVVGNHSGQPMLMAMIRAAEQVLALSGAAVRELPFDDARAIAADLSIVFNPNLNLRDDLPFRGPLVVVSTSWHEGQMPATAHDLVAVDQQGGARLAGERIARAGFNETCFIGVRDRRTAWHPASLLRLRGLEEGLGATLPAEHQLNCEGYSFVAGGRGFRRYMELTRRPTAVFAASDEIAMGFLAAAEAQGLRVRRDFHMVGFDGQNLRQDDHGPALTTVAVPAADMGRLAGELAIQRLLQPKRPTQVTYLRCSWHRGGTLGRAGSSS